MSAAQPDAGASSAPGEVGATVELRATVPIPRKRILAAIVVAVLAAGGGGVAVGLTQSPAAEKIQKLEISDGRQDEALEHLKAWMERVDGKIDRALERTVPIPVPMPVFPPR